MIKLKLFISFLSSSFFVHFLHSLFLHGHLHSMGGLVILMEEPKALPAGRPFHAPLPESPSTQPKRAPLC